MHRAPLLFALFLVGVAADAGAAERLTLDAKQSLKLKRCGKQTVIVPATLHLSQPSAWTLAMADGDYQGSYTAKGKREQKLLLEMDAAAVAEVAARLGTLASTLCETPTSVDDIDVRSFRVTRRKNGTAKMKLLARFVNASTGKKGRLKLTGAGVLEEVTTTTSTAPASTSTTSSTTSTTSSTTSTSLPPCATAPDDTPCADDGLPCTRDVCMGGTCTHPLADTSTVCREAAGLCDVAETCDGMSGECPADAVVDEGIVCRPKAGECDVSDLCDGASPVCPESFAAPTLCRAANGECDVAEFCTGSQADCPDDAFENSGRICVPAVFPCQLPGTCNGDGPHCSPLTLAPAGTVCRPADGFCDVEDTCSGSDPTCPDVGKPATTECRAAIDSCDEPEFCDGPVCPEVADDVCELGEACGADDRCASGSCNGLVCAQPVDIAQECDSTADCTGDLSCDQGLCRAGLRERCYRQGQCETGLECELLSGTCKIPLHGECEPIADPTACVEGARCWAGLCKQKLDEACQLDDECGFELVCDCDRIVVTICQPGQSCPDRCEPGVCRNGPGELCSGGTDVCTEGYECTDFNEFLVGTCTVAPLPLGAVCETDPPGGPPLPMLGDSPFDSTCESGHCFVGAGCLATEGCGNVFDPADYICCLAEGQFCTNDLECCGGFAPGRFGCGSSGTCRVLAGEDAPCTTTADCLRRGELSCQSGLCKPPPVPVVLGAGAECDPNNDLCGAGLTCFNCVPEGRGYRCADTDEPCCSSGGGDNFFCGDQVLSSSGVSRSVTKLCCNYKCSDFDAVDTCGGCGRVCDGAVAPCESDTCYYGNDLVPVCGITSNNETLCGVPEQGECPSANDCDEFFACTNEAGGAFSCSCDALEFCPELFNNDSCEDGDFCERNSDCRRNGGDADCVSNFDKFGNGLTSQNQECTGCE